MERNPYAPPVSTVADPTEIRRERPKEVTLAVKLLWTTLALGLAGMFLQPLNATAPAQWIGVIIGVGAVFGIWAWIVSKIARGRNWARILFLVLVVLGLIVTVFVMPTAMAIYRA